MYVSSYRCTLGTPITTYVCMCVYVCMYVCMYVCISMQPLNTTSGCFLYNKVYKFE